MSEKEQQPPFPPERAEDAASSRRSGTPSVDQETILVEFGPQDDSDPHQWKRGRRTFIVFTATLACINSTMGSALSANLIPYLQTAFNVPPGPQTILPASLYLVGFVFGPLVFAPLSESYGRKRVLVTGYILFLIFTMACALSPNWVAFLIFRFLAGTSASPPMSVMGGVIADVFDDRVTRGRALMFWSAATLIGPLVAPIISGFTGRYGWRWTFWAGLIIGGVSSIAVFLLPETLASRILWLKAAKLNKMNNCQRFVGPADAHRGSVLRFMKTTLSRPLHLLVSEMILSLTCLYTAFVYSVFYMLLEIFPAIFEGIYGFSRGLTGVAFTMIGVGTFLACLVHVWYDGVGPRMSAKYPRKHAEFLRLPIACAGGPAFVVALLWLGWASRSGIPWIVPLLATIPYGFAYQMIFMAMINYVADAYGIYSASALAAMGTTRSVAGALIPLAVDDMLDSLGIAWACTLLAAISAVLSVVPLGFIIWGEDIRRASKFSSKLQDQRDLALTRSLSVV
ncbi:MFS general substrate transporter [Pleurostoma richardsiae]|uniref:MFS general substrate transporter n=1 Tax=Pleurostoma richardsiae TaxID=41990 RepID=A0AA38RJI8_9PEZI|nr:MFS general substrate transporter [Pleurostoma richardsiae]